MSENALAGFIERFEEILDAMDAFESDETLDELNAQLEDTLFLMQSIDAQDADAQTEIEGALEEMDDLLKAYRDCARRRPELGQKVLELDMAIQMAKRNL